MVRAEKPHGMVYKLFPIAGNEVVQNKRIALGILHRLVHNSNVEINFLGPRLYTSFCDTFTKTEVCIKFKFGITNTQREFGL